MLVVLYFTYRRAMHFVRVIKCGGRKVNHTCCEGTTHICMRDSVSIFISDFSTAGLYAWDIIDSQMILLQYFIDMLYLHCQDLL